MDKGYTNRIWTLLSLFLLLASAGYASAATDAFEEYAEDSHFIASRGNLPDTIDQEWENTIRDCWWKITREIGPSYSEFDKTINNIGGGDGILSVYIGSAYEGQMNDSRIDEMYQKIDSYCEENCGINDIPVVFLWDEDEDNLSLPDYGPEIFEKAANSSGFIAAKGTMPVITDKTEKRDWTDLLVHCSRANDKIDDYFEDGPVISFGTSINGYLSVELDSTTPEKVNDSVIDAIYQTIDEAAEKKGVSDVPVVFLWGEIAQECLAVAESPFEEDLETENTQDEDDLVQTSPGFTSIMLVMCILILTKYRK